MERSEMKSSLLRVTMATAIVFLIALSRLIPHPWNFAPVCAAALFGGMYLGRSLGIFVPMASMLIADAVLGINWPDVPFVYGSYIMSTFIGVWIKKDSLNLSRLAVKTISGTLVSSIIFFLVTNFGSWVILDMYPKDLAGLVSAYVMGLPFFKNTLASDLIFVSLFVGAYETINRSVLNKIKSVVVSE
jgi:hypothetical protein